MSTPATEKRWMLAALVAAGALFALPVIAEQAWLAGYTRVADALGVFRLAACWICFVPAWKALENRASWWGGFGRATLAALLAIAVLT